MKNILLSLLIILGGSFYTAFGQQTKFKNLTDIEDDECIVYIYRLKSMVGGAVKWPIVSYEYDYETGIFKKSEVTKQGKINKLEYKPLVFKANKFYWITIGTNLHILFAGTKGSETIIKLKGLKSETAAITGHSLLRSNSDSGFKIADGNFKKWAGKIEDAESYIDLDIKKELLDFKFEILKANVESPLLKEIKTMKLAKK